MHQRKLVGTQHDQRWQFRWDSAHDKRGHPQVKGEQLRGWGVRAARAIRATCPFDRMVAMAADHVGLQQVGEGSIRDNLYGCFRGRAWAACTRQGLIAEPLAGTWIWPVLPIEMDKAFGF
ncbi:hypothetical protein RM96_35745 [Cupriavidus sp. IDO]|nr:hypothetical protein RM96_35745 [Cupriavidus sp. IDO]